MKRPIALLLALTLPTYAAEPARPGRDGDRPPAAAGKRQDTQKQKENLLRHIDGRIKILEDARGCVKAAADMKAVNDCHQQERKRTKALREQARSDVLTGR